MGDIVFHIGADKAGSTAIQTFLFKNKPWLGANGLHMVQAGLKKSTNHGHLFIDPEADTWDKVRAETDGIFAREPDKTAIISFEGIHFKPKPYLDELRARFSSHRVRVLYILREQAELETSGTLQRVKQFRLPFDIRDSDDFIDTDKFAWAVRDAKRTIGILIHVFGKENLIIKTYDSKELINQVMASLGIEDLSECDFSGFSNPSLTLEAAVAQQRLGALYQDAKIRDQIRDSILSKISDFGGTKKLFSEKSVKAIRGKFTKSNRDVAQEWFDRDQLFPLKDVSNDSGYDRKLADLYFQYALPVPSQMIT